MTRIRIRPSERPPARHEVDDDEREVDLGERDRDRGDVRGRDVLAGVERHEAGDADGNADDPEVQQQVRAEPRRAATADSVDHARERDVVEVASPRSRTRARTRARRSATSMLSSELLSAASATFTNASPHMMIVSAPSRSMRCCSCSGGAVTQWAIAGTIVTARPTDQRTIRGDLGHDGRRRRRRSRRSRTRSHGGAANDSASRSEPLVSGRRSARPRASAARNRSRVELGDARARRRSRRSPRARRGTSARAATGGGRRRRPGKRLACSVVASHTHQIETNAATNQRPSATLLGVRERRAQDQDRGDEDQVVEEVEPPLASGSPRSGAGREAIGRA